MYNSNNLYNKINDTNIEFKNMTLQIKNLNTEIKIFSLNTLEL